MALLYSPAATWRRSSTELLPEPSWNMLTTAAIGMMNRAPAPTRLRTEAFSEFKAAMSSLASAQLIGLVAVLFLISFTLTSLGFAIAWWMDSVQGFHAIMNLVLIPMWLLSGALFPASGAAPWVQAVMRLNPLTYAVSALRRAIHGENGFVGGDVASLSLSIEVTALFGLAAMTVALMECRRPTVKSAG